VGCTLEDLIKTIKTLNCVYAGHSGSLSIEMASLLEAAKLVENANWKMIESGALKGSRYFETEHGFVVQNPEPSNEFSLLGKNIGKALGFA
jgi:hypothetical protein